MGIKRYVKILWMYSIGISLIFLGFYMIQFMSMGPEGFGIMMPGLLFCTIGGFYGKKKLLEGQQPKTMESRQMDQIRQNVVSQLKLPGTEQASLESEEGEHGMVDRQEPRMETHEHMEVTAKPAEVLKVMVCPGCNTDNQLTNMFCSNCGKRLRAKPKAKSKKSRKRPKPEQ